MLTAVCADAKRPHVIGETGTCTSETKLVFWPMQDRTLYDEADTGMAEWKASTFPTLCAR